MSDIIYKPVIDDMTWSYSRITGFEQCPYRWYLKYLCDAKPKDMFFSSYGKFVHGLLEAYYKGEKTESQVRQSYITDFADNVSGGHPGVKVFQSYFKGGLDYFQDFQKLPYKILAVEKKVNFQIDQCSLVGYIDILAEDQGELLIIDHKSKLLQPRKAKPTAASNKELDKYLIQLYLYAIAIKEEYGVYPKYLCFNCFRTGTFIKEPFVEEACDMAREWFLSKVQDISRETAFRPDIDYFKCNYICDLHDECEYFQLSKGR